MEPFLHYKSSGDPELLLESVFLEALRYGVLLPARGPLLRQLAPSARSVQHG